MSTALPVPKATASSLPTCYADAAAMTTGRIVAHGQIAENTWRLRLDCPGIASNAIPGQFAMIRLPHRSDPLLARPLAVYDTFRDGEGQGEGSLRYADFIYAVHGKFTTALRELPVGGELIAWGPLGNGFQIPPVDHLVLVAGGIGQTALLALGRERLGHAAYGSPSRASPPRCRRVTCCWGARHAGLFGGIDDYKSSGIQVHQATLDGSAGLRGTVLDLLDSMFDAEGHPRHDETIGGPAEPAAGRRAARLHVACCGPDPMMAAVARWSADRKLPCHVSLEAPMACGIGICFTCVARVRDDAGDWDYRRTCIEGPVFDATRIEW